MPPRAEVVTHRTECLEESLHLLRRFEPLHRPLAFAHRSMRVLGSVVEALVSTVIRVWYGPLDGWHITGQLVGDNDPRLDASLRV